MQNYLTIPQGEEPSKPVRVKNETPFEYSQELEDMIVRHEGFHNGWIDVEGAGIPTTGYGFRDTSGKLRKLYPKGMSKKQALKYLREVEFPRRVEILARDTPNWDYLNNNQRMALFDLHYNIGEGSYRRSKNLRKGLKNFDWELAARNIDHGMNSGYRGLKKRRLENQALFRKKVEEDVEDAEIEEATNGKEYGDIYKPLVKNITAPVEPVKLTPVPIIPPEATAAPKINNISKFLLQRLLSKKQGGISKDIVDVYKSLTGL